MNTDHCIWVNIFDEKNGSIVKLELADAVRRMTACELPDIFEIEAAKALAVAARTAIVRKLKMYGGSGSEKCKDADISTGMKGCSYITDADELKSFLSDKFEQFYDIAQTAQEETSGLIITCGGRPIIAEYHLTCGGGTENSEDVLGNRIMYFRKVLCSYCSESPYWEQIIEMPIKELEDKLKIKIPKGNGISGPEIEGLVENIERDDTGRVRKIKIGGRIFSGTEIKELMGLSSSRFGWDTVAIRFKSRGSGSGIGMCLYGANAMAKERRGYDEILKYYYTNVCIEPIYIAGKGEPLKGKYFIIDAGHGGENEEDEKGPSGLREKDVNLYIAGKLGELLEKSGAKVTYTRETDVEVPLALRVDVINNTRPNFFISIHQNSFYAPAISGTEVYYYFGDIEGEKMSKCIAESIVTHLKTINRGCKKADLFILRDSKVSSVVVECMYISNPDEEKRLKSDDVKDELAQSIYNGILDYYGI